MTLRLPSVIVKPSLESLPRSSRARQLYPEDFFPGGNYIGLPLGRTRYWIFGPEDGVKVVLIHGLTTPGITWKDVAPKLASSGFRVLVYDLYGKGYSEAPQVPYDANLFVTQLALLLQYVKWDKAHIVGFSMGGAITAAFAATLPHLTDKLVFIASAGTPEREVISQVAVTQGPASRNVHPDPIPSMKELRLLQEENLPGYKPAIQSIVQVGPLKGLISAFEWIGKTAGHSHILIIHGTNDPVVPYFVAGVLKEKIPKASLLTIEGAGHDLLVVNPHSDTISDRLAAFLLPLNLDSMT